jgi:hypothetical protein
MIPGSANPLLLATAADGGYEIERSLRFNSADSAYLSRTPAVAGNRTTWTWAGWVKRSKIGNQRFSLFCAGNSGSDETEFFFQQSTGADALVFYYYPGSYTGFCETLMLFRDTSAWYHIVLALDTTQGTAANRCKIYVNGVQQSTNFAPNFGPSATPNINSTAPHQLGRSPTEALPYDGYLADIHFIDGQALDPTSFGEFDTNGVWQPIAYTGSYNVGVGAVNGFHLPLSDNSTAAALGTDTSGNSNTWTVNNISVTAGAGNDSLVDSPTNYGTDSGAGGEVRGNYATLNPLTPGATGLSNGNLDAASANAYPTIIPGSGSWYYEVNGTGYNWDGTLANWTPRAGSHNFGQRPYATTAPSGFKALCTTNLPEGAITTSGTFTGNALADGPFVYLNGVPTAMTINGNAVTFATHADKLSNGFKVRTSSASYNTAGSNTYSISTTGAKFKYARAQANP